jgi:hypothetical protein
VNLNVQFRNPQQRKVYYSQKRNSCFSGGFNNGKTFIACIKAITLLLTFPNYKVAICRQTLQDLKKTTMETFFKILPNGLVASHNAQDGITTLVNGSVIFWLHLEKVDESTLRGLEINMVIVDQAEEMDEKVYDVLDARVGRWDGAVVPYDLLKKFPNWPISATGKYIVPSYLLLLCNPDTEFHFIYRKYHPDSIERDPDYEFISGEWDSSLGSEETYKKALQRDPEWVNKYVKGMWGSSAAQIHKLPNVGIIEYSEALLERIQTKGNLFRILDHGDSSPTCCLWAAALDGVYIFYREYYTPNKVISYHRQAIADLSYNEHYSANYADPQIFKKTAQKDGGFWTVHDEYTSSDVDAPPLTFIPADNNEFATRNRINELLKFDPKWRHPVSRETPSIGMYFIKRSEDYPYGCYEAIRQLGAQRRILLGTIDGKSIYGDDRDENITDHAYDCIRYFVAMHGSQPQKVKRRPQKNTFAYYNALLTRRESLMPGSIQ